ncbi:MULTISPECIES: plasmid replication protein RepC [unclassified Sphingomonas]|uniref:plasmid replication protein RepC n=1 Tax=unclassified Sphingomonas TaxID=196159 RepID=UPI00226A12F3|nr:MULTISPECIES: plasmid replication protein RepC [unclassified Sphingomonas]
MTHVQTASTGRTGARPITEWSRRIARDLEARAASATDVERKRLFEVLPAAKGAIGIGTAALETLLHLISYTRPDDWKGSRSPCVWPSNATLAERADVTVGAIKERLRQLRRLGLIGARDSAHGRRTGRRNDAGEATSAFGIDLTPLRIRFAELSAMAESHTAQQRLFKEGALEIGRVRRMVGQALAQAADLRLTGNHWLALQDKLAAITSAAGAARAVKSSDAYCEALSALSGLERLVGETVDAFLFCENEDGLGSKNRPDIHIQTNPSSNLVHARRDCSSGPGAPEPNQREIRPTPSASQFKTRPDELIAMFPVTAMYVSAPRPKWSDLHRVAGTLRHALGVRTGTWVDALDCLGPDAATVALMVTAERESRNEIRLTAGAYFAGMVSKARKGELDLAKSLWAFRPETVTRQ